MELLLYFAAAIAAEGPATYRVLSYLLLREAGRYAYPSADNDISVWTNQWQQALGAIRSQDLQLSLVRSQLGDVLRRQDELRDLLVAGRNEGDGQLETIRNSIEQVCRKDADCQPLKEQMGDLQASLNDQTTLIRSQMVGDVVHDAIANALRELNLLLANLELRDAGPIDQRLQVLQDLIAMRTEDATQGALYERLGELQETVRSIEGEVARLAQQTHESKDTPIEPDPKPRRRPKP